MRTTTLAGRVRPRPLAVSALVAATLGLAAGDAEVTIASNLGDLIGLVLDLGADD